MLLALLMLLPAELSASMLTALALLRAILVLLAALALLATELVLAALLVLSSLSSVLRLILVVLSHSYYWAGTPDCGGLAARVPTRHRVAYITKVVHDASRRTAGPGLDAGRS